MISFCLPSLVDNDIIRPSDATNHKQRDKKMETILKINAAFKRHQHAINQLSLAEVQKLVRDLNAEDRDHAAKKLAIREVNRGQA